MARPTRERGDVLSRSRHGSGRVTRFFFEHTGRRCVIVWVTPGRAMLPDVGQRRVILDLAALQRLRPALLVPPLGCNRRTIDGRQSGCYAPDPGPSVAHNARGAGLASFFRSFRFEQGSLNPSSRIQEPSLPRASALRQGRGWALPCCWWHWRRRSRRVAGGAVVRHPGRPGDTSTTPRSWRGRSTPARRSMSRTRSTGNHCQTGLGTWYWPAS